MAIGIKRIQRIAVAVKDLDKSIADYKRLFNIVPFIRGIAEEEKYHWCAFELGENDCTMEFLSPWNDPKGEFLIGKFITERGEGLYMVTLRTSGTAPDTVDAMRELGIEPSWGSVAWKGGSMDASTLDPEGMWQEHYLPPKYTHGVLFTLATITSEHGIIESKPGFRLPVVGSKYPEVIKKK